MMWRCTKIYKYEVCDSAHIFSIASLQLPFSVSGEFQGQVICTFNRQAWTQTQLLTADRRVALKDFESRHISTHFCQYCSVLALPKSIQCLRQCCTPRRYYHQTTTYLLVQNKVLFLHKYRFLPKIRYFFHMLVAAVVMVVRGGAITGALHLERLLSSSGAY